MPNRQRAILILVSLSLLAVASFGLALTVGSYQVAPAEVLAALLGQAGGAATSCCNCACHGHSPVLPAAAFWHWPER